MKKFSIWSCAVLFGTFVLFSCTSKNNKIRPAIPSIQVSGDVQEGSWPEDGNLCDDFLHAEFDSVCYVPLEMNPKSLIGEISQIFRWDDSLLVVDQYVAHTLNVYDLKGKYCYTIGSQGRGPGEYNEIGYVYVSGDGRIYVADRGAGKILIYGRGGHFMREHRLDGGTPQAFVVLNDSVLLGSYAGYRPNAPYRLIWMNLNAAGDTLHTALPYQTARRYVAGSFLEGSDHEILFCHPLNDTIYKVTDSSLSPYLVMRIFEKDKLQAFMERTKDLDEADYMKALYGSDEIANLVEVMRCGGSWVVYSQQGRQTYMSVIGRERRNYLRADMSERRLYFPDSFKATWKNWVIGYINVDAIDYLSDTQREALLKSLSKACGSEVTPDFLRESNPVITMYRLKAQ